MSVFPPLGFICGFVPGSHYPSQPIRTPEYWRRWASMQSIWSSWVILALTSELIGLLWVFNIMLVWVSWCIDTDRYMVNISLTNSQMFKFPSQYDFISQKQLSPSRSPFLVSCWWSLSPTTLWYAHFANCVVFSFSAQNKMAKYLRSNILVGLPQVTQVFHVGVSQTFKHLQVWQFKLYFISVLM
jgi:hypothetical protein